MISILINAFNEGEHRHNFDEWVYVAYPTCTQEGLRIRYCSCGERQESAVAALGHDFCVTVIPASCEECGSELHKCNRCDYSESIVTPARGHSFGEWEETKPATCSDYGEERRVCLNDGAHIETRITEKLPHTFSEWQTVRAATCTEEGLKQRECSVCSETERRAIAALGHSFGKWEQIVSPSCEGSGLECRKCSVCLETENHTLEATGHSFGKWEQTVSPTCEESGIESSVCLNCGKREDKEIAPLGHKYGDWIQLTAPTCENGGLEYRQCSLCHSLITQSLPASGHSFSVWEQITEPTCEGEGLARSTCTVCHRTEEKTVAALGHSFGVWEQITEPTCEGAGLARSTCTVCNKTEEKTVAALGHSFGVWEQVAAPTCESDGLERCQCSVCHKTEENVLKAIGHKFGNWTTVTPPTCQSEGLEMRVCANDPKHIESRATDKLAHTPSDWITDKTASCEESGQKHRECTVCGETLGYATIPATGHDLDVVYDENSHRFVCKICDFVSEAEPHDWGDNECKICGFDAGGVKGLLWKLNDSKDGYVLENVNNVKADELIIPATHNGKPVVGLSEFACNGFIGTKITVPTTVTKIEGGAFANAFNLRELKIPFIGGDAEHGENFGYFFGSRTYEENPDVIPPSLKKVEITGSATKLFDNAFNNCTYITHIILPPCIESIGENSFYGCTSLEYVSMPKELKSIGGCAFWMCGALGYLEIPAKVTNIGVCAFYETAENIRIKFAVTEGWIMHDTLSDEEYSASKELFSEENTYKLRSEYATYYFIRSDEYL